MNAKERLKREFEAEDGTFLLNISAKLKWDWDEFRRLARAMYEVAEETQECSQLDRWISEAFWYFDTFIPDHTSHPCFPRPEQEAYDAAIALIHDLAYFYFRGESPYKDDALRQKASGIELIPPSNGPD